MDLRRAKATGDPGDLVAVVAASATPRWTRAAEVASTNLPVRPATLIERDSDIAHVRELLGRYRLVTVTAVGASGKTRLAVAVGVTSWRIDLKVWFVDLTAVSSDADVLGAVADLS